MYIKREGRLLVLLLLLLLLLPLSVGKSFEICFYLLSFFIVIKQWYTFIRKERLRDDTKVRMAHTGQSFSIGL